MHHRAASHLPTSSPKALRYRTASRTTISQPPAAAHCTSALLAQPPGLRNTAASCDGVTPALHRLAYSLVRRMPYWSSAPHSCSHACTIPRRQPQSSTSGMPSRPGSGSVTSLCTPWSRCTRWCCAAACTRWCCAAGDAVSDAGSPPLLLLCAASPARSAVAAPAAALCSAARADSLARSAARAVARRCGHGA